MNCAEVVVAVGPLALQDVVGGHGQLMRDGQGGPAAAFARLLPPVEGPEGGILTGRCVGGFGEGPFQIQVAAPAGMAVPQRRP